MTALVYIAAGSVVVLCAQYLLDRWMRSDAESVLAEFARRFPDRCPICSYHRHCWRVGVVSVVVKPPAHTYCPERNRR